MAFTDRPHTHDESHTAGADHGLVRVQHHARIAERGALEGVLAREGRTQQQAASRREPAFGSRRSESSSACRRNVSVRPWWRP